MCIPQSTSVYTGKDATQEPGVLTMSTYRELSALQRPSVMRRQEGRFPLLANMKRPNHLLRIGDSVRDQREFMATADGIPHMPLIQRHASGCGQ